MVKFIKIAIVASILSLGSLAQAAEVTAVNTLVRGSVIHPEDINIRTNAGENASVIQAAYVGMETNRTIYAGHKLVQSSLQPPTLVKRNNTVTMYYKSGPLTITTYGRALGQGAKGDLIQVMNMNSKSKVMAVISGPDKVTVQ